MRIVGGSLKGRRFTAPKQIPARPTTDFAKESLFNILSHQVSWPETDVLDLFAGIGSISLECISRGAQRVTSVDISFHAIKWFQRLQKELQLSNWHIAKGDVFKWLSSNTAQYDLIFADPPYDVEYYESLIDGITKEKLKEDGIFVLEHRKSDDFSHHPLFVEDRKYGEVKFSFFRLES